MAGIEIRDYEGDFEDVVELTRRVWVPEYGGQTWVPIPDAAFLRWKLAPRSGAVCPVAYEGTKLVGTFFSIPHALRIGDTVYPVGMCTGFTVAPEHRRLALPLIERLRHAGEERGLAFGIGMVLDDPSRRLTAFGLSMLKPFPRTSALCSEAAIGPIPGAARVRASRHRGLGTNFSARPRSAAPLHSLRLSQKRSTLPRRRPGAMHQKWRKPPPASIGLCPGSGSSRASSQLEHLEYATFVLERDGEIKGMVNSHCVSLQGRERNCAAMIDLWTDDQTTGGEWGSCSATFAQLPVVKQALYCLGYAEPLLRSDAGRGVSDKDLCFPYAQKFRICVLPRRLTISFTPPKTWNLEIT